MQLFEALSLSACFGTFQSAAAETPDAPYSVTEEKLQECRHGDNDEDCFLLLLVPCLEREGVEGKLVKPNPPTGVIFSAACAVVQCSHGISQ